jgi:protein gp37
MGEQTGISWTDHTFNPWWGCTKVSPGCDNCYAETFDKRVGGAHWGHGAPRRTFTEKHWNEPHIWNKKAERDGAMRRVFCASMADIFDEEAPSGELDRLWPLIDSTPYLIWQLLTKRPFGYVSKLPTRFIDHPRVWKGLTAEDQPRLNLRWPHLQGFPGVRWVSYEPALGRLTSLLDHPPDWLVIGGESGPKFRTMPIDWCYDTLELCRKANVKFFMKQMSAPTPARGKELIPENLAIQEFPS